MNTQKKIAIIGIGLMGGSLALRLRAENLCTEIIGVDNNHQHLQIALDQKIIDSGASLGDAIEAADVIIIAIPVDQTIAILPTILNRVNKQIVLDLGSTKSTIL